jgi:nucleotide-binding universal stress UspA family protein
MLSEYNVTFSGGNLGTELYVGALPYSVSAAQLQEMFVAHGTVESSRVIKGRFTGQSRGFGFVVMSCRGEAGKAMEALNDTQVEGRTIVVREARPHMIRKILAPTDLSVKSIAGVAYAISLARENSAELLFLHVAPMPLYQLALWYQSEYERTGSIPAALDETMLVESKSQLTRFVRRHFEHEINQVEWRGVARWKGIASGIVAVAANEDVDLIVMSKRERGLMSRLSRSISKSINRRGHCPVVSIRPSLEGSAWRGGPVTVSEAVSQLA